LNGALFSSNIFHDFTGAISTSGMRHLTKTKEENLGNHIHTSSRAGSRRNQQSSIVYSSRKRCDEIYGHFFWGSQQHLTTIIINQNIRNESRTFSSSSLFFSFSFSLPYFVHQFRFLIPNASGLLLFVPPILSVDRSSKKRKDYRML
jgi:hypothetical protein